MARATARVCSEPGCPHIIRDANRCPEHRRQVNRHQQQTTPTKVTRTRTERQRRAAAVNTWRTTKGDVCPGYGRPAHHSTDLTADHITPIHLGGRPDGPLTVLCRSCNSRKAARRQG